MTRERIGALRRLMGEHGIQGYVVPSTDPHQSEYVPALWERRRWLSGFTGSAGDAAVTLGKAGLWTDSRYFIQAEEQLRGSGIELFKLGVPGTPELFAWLAAEVGQGGAVGIDPRLVSASGAARIERTLGRKGVALRRIEENLVDRLWTDRPPPPDAPLEVWPERFAGEPAADKLRRLRSEMERLGADAHVVTALDAVAWLFNVRGADVEYNPVAIAYAVVTRDAAELFVAPGKVTDEARRHLAPVAAVRDYAAVRERLSELGRSGARVLVDPDSVSDWVAEAIGHGADHVLEASPIALLKAVKNPVEIAGFRAAHVRDGVALVKHLAWLDKAVPGGAVTELRAAARLEELRRGQELYRGPSFATIAAYADHGAIVHYEPTPETDARLRPEGLLLLDSGGQYLDGTTDVTRTIALGPPTAEQKDRFTRVLQGHLDLAHTSFPAGTAGKQLDTIARLPLWRTGLNFGHGTGHGVGAYLSVHEGPHAISFYRCTGVALREGMVTSIEPGFYKAGAFGIRIENLVVVVPDEGRSAGDFKFKRFENLTLCPIDLRLVEPGLLTAEEIAELDAYHREVREKLAALLDADERAWLEAATRPLGGRP